MGNNFKKWKDSVKKLNKDMYDLMEQIKEIMTKDAESLNIYKLDWNGKSDNEDSKYKSLINSINGIGESTFDYYWIELKINGQQYKISAFYKDYDRSNGNIHVIPGPIQMWKKNPEVLGFEFTAGTGIVSFPEGKWQPLLLKPYFWDRSNLNKQAKKIVDVLNKIIVDETAAEDLVFDSATSNIFYKGIEKIPDTKHYLEEKDKAIKKLRINESQLKPGWGNYHKYSLLKWYNICNENEKCISLFEINEYGNMGYFAKYGEIECWNQLYEHGDSPSSPWKAVWNLGYKKNEE